MKWLARMGILLLLAAFVGAPALASADCVFPDLAFLLHTPCELLQAQYAFSEDFICDAYVWEYPGGWKPEGDILLALFAEIYGAWEWEAGEIEGHSAFFLSNENGDSSALVSDFDGRVLALLPVACEIFAVEEGAPSESAAIQTPAPTPQADASAGHWEWQERDVDCPSCTGGWCSICNGTGTYRLYGEEIPCPIYCSACQGLGVIRQSEYRFIPGA